MDDFERQECIGDDWQEVLGDSTNYCVPLRFDNSTIDKFIRDHVCALCRGPLLAEPDEKLIWFARCPVHGPILNHNHITKATLREIESNETASRMELIAEENRKKPGRTDQDILAELGFN